MKKFLFSLLVALTLVFTACNCGCNKNVDEITDSTTVVIDTNTAVTDTVYEITADTIHCVAITKDGKQCKNHRVQGDTLCSVHRKTK